MNKIEADKIVEETEGRARVLAGWQLKFVASIAFLWSLFQLWYASPLPFIFGFGVFIDVPARAIHLGFGCNSVPSTWPNASINASYCSWCLSKIVLLVAFSDQILCHTVYSAIPEILMSKLPEYWSDAMLLHSLESVFVFACAYDCALIDGQHIYIKHSFFHTSNPMCKPFLYEIFVVSLFLHVLYFIW